MFKINKNLWYTFCVYLILELIAFLIIKIIYHDHDFANEIYLAFLVFPLILILISWTIHKVRSSQARTKRIKGLTPRDKELIFHYAKTSDIKEISYQEMGQIWKKNLYVYYLAEVIAFIMGLIFYVLLKYW